MIIKQRMIIKRRIYMTLFREFFKITTDSFSNTIIWSSPQRG